MPSFIYIEKQNFLIFAKYLKSNKMKRTILYFASLLTGLIMWTSCCQGDDSLGKSMGRWKGFSVESMTQSRIEGLEYIEVTMMDVIGKDTAGVRDRAALLKAQID